MIAGRYSDRVHLCLLLGLVWIAVLSSAAPTEAQRPSPVLHGIFQEDSMYTVLPPDKIPAILSPEVLTGKEADAQMTDDEPVIGLVIDGDARAYSMWHLDAHEIVNDVIGGKAIAVTW